MAVPTTLSLREDSFMTIYHDHHFVPRHSGGTDDPSNIVRVTVAEHVAFHYERWVVTGDRFDEIAWKALAGQITMSEASRRAILEARERSRGQPRSEETRKKISDSSRGRIWSAESRAKVGAALRGRKLKPEVLATRFGRAAPSLSEEGRAKIIASNRRRRTISPTPSRGRARGSETS
jgi:NUMOD3 motif